MAPWIPLQLPIRSSPEFASRRPDRRQRPRRAGSPRNASRVLPQSALVYGTVPALRKPPMAETGTRAIFDRPPDEALETRRDADAEAEAACKAGRAVPHERLRAWLVKLAKGGTGSAAARLIHARDPDRAGPRRDRPHL